MSHADLDHDGQRELEQRALRNVSWLAAKLGYQDVLDRRTERKLVFAMAAVVLVAIIVLPIAAMLQDTPQQEMERRRCEVSVRVQETVGMRTRIFDEHPEMTAKQRDDFLEKSMATLAASRCSATSSAK